MSNAWVKRIQTYKGRANVLGFMGGDIHKISRLVTTWSHSLTVKEPLLTKPFSATKHIYFIFFKNFLGVLNGFKLLLRSSVS